MWVNRQIVQWHRQTFPQCTFAQQRKKLILECRELKKALKSGGYVEQLEEMADVYIVAVVLFFRYGDDSAWFILKCFETMKNRKEIADAVDAKMNVNVERVFKLINGEWRHVGEKGK